MGREGSSKKSPRRKKQRRRHNTEGETQEETSSRVSPKKRTGERDSKSHKTHKTDKKKSSSHHRKRRRSGSQHDNGSGDEKRSRKRKSEHAGECLTVEHSISRSVSPVRQQGSEEQADACMSKAAVPSLESAVEDPGSDRESVDCPLAARTPQQTVGTPSTIEGTQPSPAPALPEKEDGGAEVLDTQDEACKDPGTSRSTDAAKPVEGNYAGASPCLTVAPGDLAEKRSAASMPEGPRPGNQHDTGQMRGDSRGIPKRRRPGEDLGAQATQQSPPNCGHAVSLSRDVRVMNYRDRLAESWRRFRRLQSTRVGFVTLDAPRTVLVWWAQQQKSVEKANQLLAVGGSREGAGAGKAPTKQVAVKTEGEFQDAAEHGAAAEAKQEEVKGEQSADDSVKKDDAFAESFADEEEVWSQARQRIKGDDNAVMEEALQIVCSDAAGRKVEILALSGLRLYPKFGGRPNGVSGQRMCEKIVKYVRRHDNACLHYHLLCPFFAEDSDAQEHVERGEIVEPFDEDWVLTQAAIESDAEVAYEEEMDSLPQEKECSRVLLKDFPRGSMQTERHTESSRRAGESPKENKGEDEGLPDRNVAEKDALHARSELEQNATATGGDDKGQGEREEEESDSAGDQGKEEPGTEKDEDSDVEGAATAADDDMHSVEEGTEEGSGGEKASREGEEERVEKDGYSRLEEGGGGEGGSGSEGEEEEQGVERDERRENSGAEKGHQVGDQDKKGNAEGNNWGGPEASKAGEANREETEGEAGRRLRPDKDRHSRWPAFRGNWSKRQADQIRGGGVGLLLDSTHRGYVRRWKAVNSRLMWCLLHVPSASTALLDPLLRKINRLWIVVACAPDEEEEGKPAAGEPVRTGVKKEEKPGDEGEGAQDADAEEEKEEAVGHQEETHDEEYDEPSAGRKHAKVRSEHLSKGSGDDESVGSGLDDVDEDSTFLRSRRKRRDPEKSGISGDGDEGSVQGSGSTSPHEEEGEVNKEEESEEDKGEESEEDKEDESEEDKKEQSEEDKKEQSEEDKDDESEEERGEGSDEDQDEESGVEEGGESEVDKGPEESADENDGGQREKEDVAAEEGGHVEGRRPQGETEDTCGDMECPGKQDAHSEARVFRRASTSATPAARGAEAAAAATAAGLTVDSKYAAFLHSLECIFYRMRSNDSLLLLGDLKAPIDHPERCPDMLEQRRAFPGVLGPYFCPPVLSNERMEAVRAKRRGRRTFPPVVGPDGTIDTKLPEHQLTQSTVSPRTIALLKLFSKFNLLITNTAREYPCPDDYATLRGLGAAGPGLPEFVMRSLIVVRQRDRVHLHGTSVCTSAKRVHCIHRQVVATLRIRCNSLGTFHYYCPKQLTSVQQQKMNERHRRKMRSERTQPCIVGPAPVISAPQPMLLVHRPAGSPGNLLLAAAPPPPVQPAPAVLIYNAPRPPPGQPPPLVAARPGFIPSPPVAPPPPAASVLARQPPPPPTAQQPHTLYAVSQPAPPGGVIYVQPAAGPVLSPTQQPPPPVVWVANSIEKLGAQIGNCPPEGAGVFAAGVGRRSPPRRVVMLSDAPKGPPQRNSLQPREHRPPQHSCVQPAECPRPQRSSYQPQERPPPSHISVHPQERQGCSSVHDRRLGGQWEMERNGVPSTGTDQDREAAWGEPAGHAKSEVRERWRPMGEGRRVADEVPAGRGGETRWDGGREQANEARWRDERRGESAAFLRNYGHEPEGPRPGVDSYGEHRAPADGRGGCTGNREDEGYTRMQDTGSDYYCPPRNGGHTPAFEKSGRPVTAVTRETSFPRETDGVWQSRDATFSSRNPSWQTRPGEDCGSGWNTGGGGRLQGSDKGEWSCNRGYYGHDCGTARPCPDEPRHQEDQRWYSASDYYQQGSSTVERGGGPLTSGGGPSGMHGEGCASRFDTGGGGAHFDGGGGARCDAGGGPRLGGGEGSTRFGAGCGDARFDGGGGGVRFDGESGARFDAGVDARFGGRGSVTRFDDGAGAACFDGGGSGGRFEGGGGGARFYAGGGGGRFDAGGGGGRFDPGGVDARVDAGGGGPRFDAGGGGPRFDAGGGGSRFDAGGGGSRFDAGGGGSRFDAGGGGSRFDSGGGGRAVRCWRG